MFRPLTRSHRRPHRRGTSFVLIVVVMISFAASVGVAFALFAGQTLRIAAAYKEGQGGGGQPIPRPPEPTNTVNAFLAALIYDVGDGTSTDPNVVRQELANVVRGNSMAASMYGRRPGNTTAWDGVGTFHQEINYTQMMQGGNPYLRDRSTSTRARSPAPAPPQPATRPTRTTRTSARTPGTATRT